MNLRKGLGIVACVIGVLLPVGLGAQQKQPSPPTAMGPKRPPMERAFGPRGPHPRWWDDPQIAQKIGLTEDQRKKMDDIFHQHRLKLIDLEANLRKEEIAMEPLVDADQPDEPKLLAQIDKVAQARAELEKANARMLLGIRRVMTADQWKKLQAEHREGREHNVPPPPGWGGGPHGQNGPPGEPPHGMDD